MRMQNVCCMNPFFGFEAPSGAQYGVVDCTRGKIASTDILAPAEMPEVKQVFVRLGAQVVDVLDDACQLENS